MGTDRNMAKQKNTYYCFYLAKLGVFSNKQKTKSSGVANF